MRVEIKGGVERGGQEGGEGRGDGRRDYIREVATQSQDLGQPEYCSVALYSFRTVVPRVCNVPYLTVLRLACSMARPFKRWQRLLDHMKMIR